MEDRIRISDADRDRAAARLGGGIVQVARVGTPEQVRAAERLLEETRRGLYRILAGDADDADDGEDADQDM